MSGSVDHEPVVAIRAAPLRRCNRCGAVPNEVQVLLDSRKGKSVRIIRCRCGEESWSEEV